MRINNLLYFFILLCVFASCRNNTETSGTAISASDTSKRKLEELNAKISKNPNDPELYNSRAKFYMLDNQFDLALKDINKATTLSPDNATYYLSLSDIYLLMGSTTNCGEALNKALSLDPASNDAFLKLARLNLILREYKTAAGYIQKALDKESMNPQAYFIKALVLLETGDTVKAVENLKIAVDQNQKYFEALMELGQLYTMKKDKIAAGYFKNALKVRPNNREANYNLGMVYQETGQYEEAIKAYTVLSKMDSTYRNPPYNIGYIYLVYLKDFKKAQNFFAEAIRRDPGYYEAYFNRGYAYELDGQYANASKDYHRALEIKTNWDKAIDGLNRLDKLTGRK